MALSHHALPVSVVIPAHNRETFVAVAVRSALSQEPPPREVIVVDDRSQDSTADAAQDAGARVLRLPRNQGEGGARSAGVKAAQCEWVAFLDSDDYWLPGHLALLWPKRMGHVLVGVAGLGEPSGRLKGAPLTADRVLTSPADVFWPDNPLTPSGVLAHRDSLVSAGLFPHRAQAADLAAWVEVLQLGTGLVVPGPTWCYREHDGQVSLDRRAMYRSVTQLLVGYVDRPWYSAGLRRRVAAQQTWDELRAAMARQDHLEAVAASRRLISNPYAARSLPALWRYRAAQRAWGR